MAIDWLTEAAEKGNCKKEKKKLKRNNNQTKLLFNNSVNTEQLTQLDLQHYGIVKCQQSKAHSPDVCQLIEVFFIIL